MAETFRDLRERGRRTRTWTVRPGVVRTNYEATSPPTRMLYNWVYFIRLVFSTGGSDSSVSDGLPMHLIYAPEGLKMVRHITLHVMNNALVSLNNALLSLNNALLSLDNALLSLNNALLSLNNALVSLFTVSLTMMEMVTRFSWKIYSLQSTVCLWSSLRKNCKFLACHHLHKYSRLEY